MKNLKPNASSIVDVPKKAKELDQFGIDKYKNGLIQFINNSDTPITIAIQGEWGSGKTSLLNSLQEKLCGDYIGEEALRNHQHDFYGIWINTWQYSLLRSQEETLTSIVSSLSAQIINIINIRHKSSLEKFGKSFLGFGGKLLKGAVSVVAEHAGGESAASAVETILEREKAHQTIKHLRDELQIAINDCIENDKKNGQIKKGFLIFVDDLDRIDPPVAVQILELLKNIFDLENCIFMLAIDYDVVIKGLKPKFGELTEKNEREFRSFFDKIIQMPFSMPVASYSIDKFLIENLETVGYIDKVNSKNDTIAERLSMICNLSVGTNPRSLKRLLNTVSLITIINNQEENDEVDNKTEVSNLLINFGLICIQIAYPLIYKSLCMESDFKKWNEAIATKLKLRELSADEIKKLSQAEEFDEVWEQVVFRICEKDTFLSNRVSQISQLLNIIAALIPEGKNLGEVIEEVLELSAVTDIQAFDKPKQAINKGPVLKTLGSKLMPLLQARLKAPYPVVRQLSKKVQSNFFIAYSKPDEGWVNALGLSVAPNKDTLKLIIWRHPWSFAVKSNNMRQDLKSEGYLEEFELIAKEFDMLEKTFPKFKMRFPGISSSGIAEKKWHVPNLTFEYEFTNPQELYDSAMLNKTADFITEFMQLFSKLSILSDAYNLKVVKTN